MHLEQQPQKVKYQEQGKKIGRGATTYAVLWWLYNFRNCSNMLIAAAHPFLFLPAVARLQVDNGFTCIACH